jgi:hypothetical protein
MSGSVVKIAGSQEPCHSFYPDFLFELRSGTFQRAQSVRADETLQQATPVDLLAILIARPRSNVGFGDRNDTVHRETADQEAKRWIAFLVLTTSLRHSGAYGRLGILKRVTSTPLPKKWYETWPQKEVIWFELRLALHQSVSELATYDQPYGFPRNIRTFAEATESIERSE